MSDVIEGLKLIKHNASGVNEPDDPSYPFKLMVSLRPPEFMTMAFICMYGGTEEIIVRGMTREALQEFSDRNHLQHHVRLISWTLE